jgi:hypothetical protein
LVDRWVALWATQTACEWVARRVLQLDETMAARTDSWKAWLLAALLAESKESRKDGTKGYSMD